MRCYSNKNFTKPVHHSVRWPWCLVRAYLLPRVAIATLVIANMLMAAWLLIPEGVSAHSLGYHWNRYYKEGTTSPGPDVYIRNDATYYTPANDALNEWNTDTILDVFEVGNYEDIYLFDNNDGATSYCGAWAAYVYDGTNHLKYGRAMYNTYCGGDYYKKRAIFCQEIGHGFGLAHSDNGCMGYGYYNSAYTVWQHNIDDIYNQYRYNHH